MTLEFIERHGAAKTLNYVKGDGKAEHLSKLTHLFLNNRRLHEVGDLSDCKRLKVLYLHDNAIEKIENVLQLTTLTHLYLQHNRIKRVDHLNGLFALRKLYLGGNEIERLENVDQLARLEELHIDRQRLPVEKSFEFDTLCLKALAKSLRVLNVTGLGLTEIDALKHCYRLETLMAAENRFGSAAELGQQLTVFPCLRNVILNYCPAQKDIHYRDKIMAGAIQIQFLDGKEIPRNTLDFVKRFEEAKAERNKFIKPICTAEPTVAAKPLAASMRATKSLMPTLDILMSDEAILFQTWNQLHPTNIAKKASIKSPSHRRRPTNIPLRGRPISNSKSLASI